MRLKPLGGLSDELVDEVRGVLGGDDLLCRRLGLALERWLADLQRVGFLDARVKPLAAHEQHEAVLLHLLDDRLHARQHDLLEVGDGLRALLGRDAPGASVDDQPVLVDSGKVAACGDITGAQVKPDARRFQRAAPDTVAQRVIAEQREVAGAAAGLDAPRDGNRHAGGAFLRQPVHVGG